MPIDEASLREMETLQMQTESQVILDDDHLLSPSWAILGRG